MQGSKNFKRTILVDLNVCVENFLETLQSAEFLTLAKKKKALLANIRTLLKEPKVTTYISVCTNMHHLFNGQSP